MFKVWQLAAKRLVFNLLFKGKTMISWKKLALAFISVLVVCLACFGAHKAGLKQGLQNYHDQCYNIGGFVVDEVGHVVACAPQGTIPKEELKNFKDNT